MCRHLLVRDTLTVQVYDGSILCKSGDEFCIYDDEFCCNNDELCIETDEFCIKNDECYIKNDDLCIKNDGSDAPLGGHHVGTVCQPNTSLFCWFSLISSDKWWYYVDFYWFLLTYCDLPLIFIYIHWFILTNNGFLLIFIDCLLMILQHLVPHIPDMWWVIMINSASKTRNFTSKAKNSASKTRNSASKRGIVYYKWGSCTENVEFAAMTALFTTATVSLQWKDPDFLSRKSWFPIEMSIV